MLLGLDLGTTAVKAVVLDPARGLLAADSLPNAPASPKPGWSEQDAEAWLGNALALIPRVCAAAGIDPSAVACVGVAGCVPCVVLLGADDRPLRPALLYNDGRAHAEIDELNAELADARVLQRTGAGITQQSVGPKLRWLQRHEPGVWARTRRVAGSYDWLAGQLTEVGFSERNWALESGLYDEQYDELSTEPNKRGECDGSSKRKGGIRARLRRAGHRAAGRGSDERIPDGGSQRPDRSFGTRGGGDEGKVTKCQQALRAMIALHIIGTGTGRFYLRMSLIGPCGLRTYGASLPLSPLGVVLAWMGGARRSARTLSRHGLSA